jgi:hypothetical protein
MTVDEMEIPHRNGYGRKHEKDLDRVAVSVTITHDVVGLELTRLPDGNPYSLIGDFVQVFMSRSEAERLIGALQEAIDENNKRMIGESW